MDIEPKERYYSYIKDLDILGISHPYNSASYLRKKWPNLTEAAADRIVNMYLKEEVEGKQQLLKE